MNDIIYSWNFSNNKERGSLWYIIALSVVIGLVVWGFLTKQYVMSFLIILITGVSFFIENNSEENTSVSITNLGIKINSSFYDFPKIRSYGFIYEGENAVFLRLSFHKKGIAYVDLEVDNGITIILKDILPHFIPQDENTELTLTERMIRFFKL